VHRPVEVAALVTVLVVRLVLAFCRIILPKNLAWVVVVLVCYLMVAYSFPFITSLTLADW
jgi:ABC-type multidrug transport system permease subunit